MSKKVVFAPLAAALALGAATPLLASADGPRQIDFGDDASPSARDGECDDKRFAGPAMSQGELIDSDVLHDATDCRAAYRAGRLRYVGKQERRERNAE